MKDETESQTQQSLLWDEEDDEEEWEDIVNEWSQKLKGESL